MIFYLFWEAGYEAKHEGENPRGGDYTLLSGNHDDHYNEIDNDNDDDDFCQTFKEEIMKMRRICRRRLARESGHCPVEKNADHYHDDDNDLYDDLDDNLGEDT